MSQIERSKKKRVFVGIKIEKEIYDEIQTWKKRYMELNVRWIKPNNLHVTLTPPWYEEKVRSVSLSLRKIIENAHINPFTIQFKRVSYGPDPIRPRLIWAEGRAPEELIDLKAILEKSFGKVTEKRQYKLHLTLARFNPKHFKSFKIRTIENKINWKQKVNSITLFESKLLPKGAEYLVLENIRF